MYNTNESIEGFARSCFEMALMKKMPLFLSTKNTILKKYDGTFKDIFQSLWERDYKAKYEAVGISYEHRLVGWILCFRLMIWLPKLLSHQVGLFGHVNLMMNNRQKLWRGCPVWYSCPRIWVVGIDDICAHHSWRENSRKWSSPWHCHVSILFKLCLRRHFREHQQGKDTSTNPIASIFAWTRGYEAWWKYLLLMCFNLKRLMHRAKLDDTPELTRFCEILEESCLEAVQSHEIMTKDLALSIYKEKVTL